MGCCNNEINVEIGKPAPIFQGEAYHNGKIETIRLDQYQGKWVVLFFYPKDFTFVCPTELGEMADIYDELQNSNVEVISVSTDTAVVHKAWHDVSPLIGKIKFPMLADPTGIVCKTYKTYIREEGISNRATFIIDPDGIIRAFEMHDDGIGRSSTEILRKIQAAQYVKEHPGEVCPMSWKPGDKTLKPGLDLVGKL